MLATLVAASPQVRRPKSHASAYQRAPRGHQRSSPGCSDPGVVASCAEIPTDWRAERTSWQSRSSAYCAGYSRHGQGAEHRRGDQRCWRAGQSWPPRSNSVRDASLEPSPDEVGCLEKLSVAQRTGCRQADDARERKNFFLLVACYHHLIGSPGITEDAPLPHQDCIKIAQSVLRRYPTARSASRS